MSDASKDKLIKLGYLFIVWIIILALIFGFVLFIIADEPLGDTKKRLLGAKNTTRI